MGRLRRDINKKVKSTKQSFDSWYDQHKERINSVTEPREQENDLGGVKTKIRVGNIIGLATGLLMIIAVILTVAVLWRSRSETQPQIPDLTFGEESVEAIKLNEEEIAEIMEQVPRLDVLEDKDGAKFIYQVDNSVVMSLVSGELETANDFYLVEVRIAYNDNFIFLDKWEYETLENKTLIGDTTILYEAKGKDYFGLDVFLAVTETDTGLVYWKVSCIEGLFDEWLQIMFG